MSGHLLPTPPPGNGPVTPSHGPTPAPEPWGGALPAPDEPGGVPWARYVAALKRYKWVMLLIVLIGTSLGVAATRFLRPLYRADATLWLSSEAPISPESGPIRANGLASANSWVELLKSFAILEQVVEAKRLYLTTEPGDSLAFAGFGITDQLRPGRYVLAVDAAGRSYTLSRIVEEEQEQLVERGAVGDSIGRALGFTWAPGRGMLLPGRRLVFGVAEPHAVAASIRGRMDVVVPSQSAFMKVSLVGADPEHTAATLNAVVEEFIVAARDLKRRNMDELQKILDQQMQFAARELREAEVALENFKVNTITLPTNASPVTPGLAMTRDPFLDSFFAQRIMQDEVRRDREALARLIAEAREGGVRTDAFYTLPGVLQSTPGLRATLEELERKQAELRAARQMYTDAHPTVQTLQRDVNVLRTQTIPEVAQGTLTLLQRREAELDRRIASASRDLEKIPARTIEEMRLVRNVQVAENLFSTLQNRYEAVRLSAASVIADVSVLDRATPPSWPTENKAPMIVLMAFGASTALAGALALLLDRTDRRFRYPEQASHELGLEIVGAIPMLKTTRGIDDVEHAAQVVEAFRSLRLAVRNAYPVGTPVVLTISSPGPADGKSMITANLALSFAEAGHRTLVIDGDTRRGQLHRIFGVERRPGLLDLLMGDAALSEVLRPTTAHEYLTLLPCGSRRHRGPELLTSPQMPRLIADLRAQYDVVLVDSPPLGVGIDAFALGSATGNMLMVLRTGATDRRMAQRKLDLLDRLPVRLVGAVLNDIRTSESMYAYYSYLGGYTIHDEEELPEERSRVGALARRGG